MSAVGMDEETVHQAAQDTFNTKQTVEGNLGTIKGVVDNVLGSWEGEAAKTFEELMEVWDEEAKDLLEQLETIGQLLDESAYNAAEADAAGQEGLNEYASELMG
ncbi:WXG100 family type VII secretion target [Haloglycomyces albus]|uniref:WXG100 family type VII secretion target n=1 Tax=Haloglycomyces albus TaxID=526067 RepID=UPI00046D46A6|nr:WXG100 family type VII secretion target [Haloglycomyces albus]